MAITIIIHIPIENKHRGSRSMKARSHSLKAVQQLGAGIKPASSIHSTLLKVQPRMPEVGDFVVYHDGQGREHRGLIIEVWSPVMVNLAFVVDDASRKDKCGRQLERIKDALHKAVNTGPVNYWRFPDESPNPRVASAKAVVAHAVAG